MQICVQCCSFAAQQQEGKLHHKTELMWEVYWGRGRQSGQTLELGTAKRWQAGLAFHTGDVTRAHREW